MILPIGTPLWKKPSSLSAPTQDAPNGQMENTLSVAPADCTVDHSVFVGVTVRDLEDTEFDLWVQRTGQMLVRAKGPVRVGDRLCQVEGADYLEAGSSSAPVAGTAEGEVAAVPDEAGDEAIFLVLMRAEGGGGGGTGGDAVWS